jgi:hypothetical protein
MRSGSLTISQKFKIRMMPNSKTNTKNISWTNTLAYFVETSEINKKGFIYIDTWVNYGNLLWYRLFFCIGVLYMLFDYCHEMF